MAPQQQSWTCSICSYTWVVQATGTDPGMTRDQAANIIGYPNCVNETYGLMSAQCMVDAFSSVGLVARQIWCTFEEAYSICRNHTGVINPIGMYHFMGIRGVSDSFIWVANSAQGYRGIYDLLDKHSYNSMGPTQLIYLT